MSFWSSIKQWYVRIALHFRNEIKFPYTLRKHAYSNILKILPSKNENFQIKISDILNNPAQNINCGTRWNRLSKAILTSTHNLCFWAEIRKIMYTSVNPSFTVQKWGLSGSNLCRHVFAMKFVFLGYRENCHYKNRPIQIYWKCYHQKKIKKFRHFWYFSLFCSKHRLWVLVRIASARQLLTIYVFWAEIRKIMYTL